MPAESMTRIPPLEGALNFRDMGGYLAADGRSVRWGQLFRSGTTHAMTPADVASLSARGIRFAYDLRSNKERRDYPNRLREIANLDYRFRDHDQLPGDIRRLLRSPDVAAEDSHRMMLDVYRKLPYEFADAFTALFNLLLNGEMPLVFNCTAGKDRTGAAAALVLTALGVPRDVVMEDYLLTQQFFERSCELILKEGGPFLASIPKAIWEPLMRVHPDYLHSMFEQLETSHGSVSGYMRDLLGIDPADVERLRANLLQ